jgi:crotonobetainyl-CoA:carnitine CoA-transferase CaiB-like acyl-CoA transferase
VTVGDGDRAVDVVRNPIQFSNAEIRYDEAPPLLGEHSDEIRAWLADAVR